MLFFKSGKPARVQFDSDDVRLELLNNLPSFVHALLGNVRSPDDPDFSH
jgi:hypothetical protein